MSQEQLIEVVGRAVVDVEFRELLISKPEDAIKEYELTDKEMAMLKNVKPETLDAISSELEERVSRAGFTPGGLLNQMEPSGPTGLLGTRDRMSDSMRRVDGMSDYMTHLNALSDSITYHLLKNVSG